MSWNFELTDIATDATLADITQLALTAKVSPRLNRALTQEHTLPADQSLIQTIHSDGDPYLYPGSRAIKSYQDGVLRAHTIITTCSYAGDTETDPKVVVASADPVVRLPTRQIWDDTGHIADPTFDSPMDAGLMLWTAIENSLIYDDNQLTDPITSEFVTPLIFPIDISSGQFTTTADMSEFFTDGPQTIGDLYTALVDTGQVDVVLVPVDSSMGYAPGIMAQLNVVPEWGSDLSGTVHFDYFTGSKNVTAARRVLDVTTLATKLTYELGPKLGKDRWRGNITPTDNGDDYLHMSLQARKKFGAWHQVRVYDTDNENDSRPLYKALWKTEMTLRHAPRDLLYMTPVAAADDPHFTPAFRPFIDYGIGDTVAVNASAVLGKAFSGAQQRVYGFDVTIDENGVERVGELITSADAG